jgi:hypothetical protein
MQTKHIHFLFAVILIFSIVGCLPQSTPTQNATPLPSMTPTHQSALETLEGTFRNQISLLEENMPRSGSEAYVIPSEEEQAGFVKVVSLIYNKKLADAVALADKNHYRLNYYVDQGEESAVSYLLREQKPVQKGWGLYAFRVDSTSNIIIEAPHPLYDRRTPTVAMDIYRALDARALLIAGAHRNANSDGSADVAHAPESVFHSVHESLVSEIQSNSETAIVLQIHGFHSSKHDGYPQAVLGFGKTIQYSENTVAQTLETALSAQGIEVGLCVDDTWKQLCGRTNGQGAIPNGTIFIHMELDENIRKNDQALIAALLQVFGQ